MPFSGNKVDNYSYIKQLIDDKSGGKGRDKKHYFYIIQMPECGKSRIKIGKSSNIYARFKYYQEHFHGSQVKIHDLRWFPNIDTDRFGEKGLKLYALYEREVAWWLREFNKEKRRDGLGKLTEWFDEDTSSSLLRKYRRFPKEFSSMKFDKTQKREGLRSQNPENISDDEEDDNEPVVVRRSTRNR